MQHTRHSAFQVKSRRTGCVFILPRGMLFGLFSFLLKAAAVRCQTLFQRARMKLEQVVVIVVKIKGTALAGDAAPRLPHGNAGLRQPLFIGLKLAVADLEGNVVVRLFRQGRPFHDDEP